MGETLTEARTGIAKPYTYSIDFVLVEYMAMEIVAKHSIEYLLCHCSNGRYCYCS